MEEAAEDVEMTSFSSGLVDAGDGTFAPTGKEGLVLWFRRFLPYLFDEQ